MVYVTAGHWNHNHACSESTHDPRICISHDTGILYLLKLAVFFDKSVTFFAPITGNPATCSFFILHGKKLTIYFFMLLYVIFHCENFFWEPPFLKESKMLIKHFFFFIFHLFGFHASLVGWMVGKDVWRP